MQEQVTSDLYTHRFCRKAHGGDKSGVRQYCGSAVENRFAPANGWHNVSATFRDSNIYERSRNGWRGGGGDSPEESVKERRKGEGEFFTFSCINDNALWSRNNSSRDVDRPACSETRLGIKIRFLVRRLPVCVWTCVSQAPERLGGFWSCECEHSSSVNRNP